MRQPKADPPDLHLGDGDGMHKYNNQDLAMVNAMLAARGTLAGALLHQLCNVNEDPQCHEAGYAGMRQTLDTSA